MLIITSQHDPENLLGELISLGELSIVLKGKYTITLYEYESDEFRALEKYKGKVTNGWKINMIQHPGRDTNNIDINEVIEREKIEQQKSEEELVTRFESLAIEELVNKVRQQFSMLEKVVRIKQQTIKKDFKGAEYESEKAAFLKFLTNQTNEIQAHFQE